MNTAHMQISLPDILGTIAGILTTIAFIPQVLQTWKTRNVEGVDAGMYIIFTSGVAMWIAYGVSILSVPVIFFNSITFSLALMQLLMILRFRRPVNAMNAVSSRPEAG